MILCLDCGNTRIKWGLREACGWLASGAIPTVEAGTIAAALPPSAAFTSIVACNVAGADVAAAVQAALPQPVTWNPARQAQCGVSNGYDSPAQLGADRWAALIGAWSLQQNACLVVCAGTATTIDVLDSTGMFRGGLILPGTNLMRASLARGTAQLPEARGCFRELPTNTDDAIESGVIQAKLGAIERMFRRVASAPGARCVLSGGAAEQLLPHLTVPVLAVENLVLQGLARIADTTTPAPADSIPGN